MRKVFGLLVGAFGMLILVVIAICVFDPVHDQPSQTQIKEACERQWAAGSGFEQACERDLSARSVADQIADRNDRAAGEAGLR